MTYTIFGGINGVGKSTMYQFLSDEEKAELGMRINVDELVSSMGNWQDAHTQIKASRQIVANIKHCLNNNISFNQETTLSGYSILSTIYKAKTKGFIINLNYVFVDNVEIAKERVKERVKRGGHGVPDEIIEHRFISSFANLKKVIPLCNTVTIYNNTTSLMGVLVIKMGQLIYNDKYIPKFVLDILT